MLMDYLSPKITGWYRYYRQKYETKHLSGRVADCLQVGNPIHFSVDSLLEEAL